MEKLLLIGLGLLVVMLVQFLPFAGDRQAASSAGRAAPTAAPTRTAPPTPVPVEALAPPAEEPPAAPESSRASTADPPTYRVVAGGSGANLRNAPSTGAPVVRRLSDGAVVTNLNQQQTADGIAWRRVAEDDAEGWVAAELLVP